MRPTGTRGYRDFVAEALQTGIMLAELLEQLVIDAVRSVLAKARTSRQSPSR